MRLKLIITALICNVFSCLAQNWTLTESYEFHSSDQSNHDNVWNIGLPWWDYDACGTWHSPAQGSAHMNSELQAYNLTAVAGGANSNIQYANVTAPSGTYDCLRIIATKGLNYPYAACTTGVQYNYKSGMIRLKNTYFYGKFEIRCKIPNEKALWPGFWLIDPAMANGEIDIMETANGYTSNSPSGTAPEMWNNIHGWGSSPVWHQGIKYQPTVDISADFHIYSLEWTPFYLKFLFDGKETWMLSQSGQSYFPNVGSMELLINLAVNNSPGPDATADTHMSSSPSTASLDVDYVRIYSENCSSYVLCNSDTQTSITNSYNVDLAIPEDINYDGTTDPYVNSPTSVCAKSITNSAPLSVTAANLITMHPGFSADATGSSSVPYIAQISACNNTLNPHRNTNKNTELAKLSEQESNNSVSLFPNPSMGKINLLTKISDDYYISILDVVGSEIRKINFSGMLYEGDFSDLAKGIYAIIINNKNKSFSETLRLIIN